MNNGLFVVIEKTDRDYPFTPACYTVYAVRDDSNGYPHFLIYDNDAWLWISAKHFRPKNAFD